MFGFQTMEMIMKGNLGGEMSLNCLLLPVLGQTIMTGVRWRTERSTERSDVFQEAKRH